jgi:formamidopyrimidine-DNA glycosylase
MPELPEVTTTVNGLNKKISNLSINSVWTDLAKKNQNIKQFKSTIKDASFFEKFKKEIIGKKILNVKRRAKNILINIEGNKTILIHLKMTGHLLFGEYTKKIITKDKLKITKWEPKNDGPLKDPYNRFIHVMFELSNNKYLAFCDSRKFGKVTLIPSNSENNNIHLNNIGPEPLDKNFNFEKFKQRLFLRKNNNIKTVLIDQSILAGIGNIYSDEMLWLSSVNPESKPIKIPEKQLKKLFESMKEILEKGINLGGDSMSDYRNIDGEKGNFQNYHNVYKKKNEKCSKRGCNGVILRKVLNGRSAHFCDTHQKIY